MNRIPTDAKCDHIREVVRGIGKKRKAIGKDSRRGFDKDKCQRKE